MQMLCPKYDFIMLKTPAVFISEDRYKTAHCYGTPFDGSTGNEKKLHCLSFYNSHGHSNGVCLFYVLFLSK